MAFAGSEFLQPAMGKDFSEIFALSRSGFSDEALNLRLRFAEFLLQPAQEFFFLAFFQQQVVIGQMRKLLFEFACNFFPGSFEFKFVHKSFSKSYFGIATTMSVVNSAGCVAWRKG